MGIRSLVGGIGLARESIKARKDGQTPMTEEQEHRSIPVQILSEEITRLVMSMLSRVCRQAILLAQKTAGLAMTNIQRRKLAIVNPQTRRLAILSIQTNMSAVKPKRLLRKSRT